MPISPTADREIVITRLLKAPRELVFEVWTKPEHIDRWFGPAAFKTTTRSMEVRPGGQWRFVMQGMGQDFPDRIVYQEVVPPERLVYTHSEDKDNDANAFHVTVTFEVEGKGTRLTMRSVFATAAARDFVIREHKAIEGGNQTVDKLETYLAAKHPQENVMTERSAQHATFTVERTLKFPREKVFAAWADPNAKAKWFGGGEGKWKELVRESDFRVGGHDRARGAWNNGVTTDFQCRYQDIVPNERIVYVYDMYLDEKKISVSLATVEFKSVPGGTKMIVTEQGAFLDGYDDAGSREQGTRTLMDALEASLST